MNDKLIYQLREPFDDRSTASKAGESKDPFVAFIYTLLRDHVPAGVIAAIVKDLGTKDCVYSNGWLVAYASDIVERLRGMQ